MRTCGIGRVQQVSGGQALIEIQREEACQHCSAADICNAIGSRGTLRIEADDPIGVRPGQLVEVAPVRSAGLQAALFVYLLPALLFVAAVALSSEIWHLPPWASALTGFGALVAAWSIARLVDRRVRRRPEFRLRVIRILEAPDAGAGRPAGESGGRR